MAAGWGKKKGSVLLTLHYFKDSNGLSLCEMASGTEKVHENPDEYWKCDVCKRKVKDGF